MENIEQTVNGTAANSGRVSVTVARNGDLVADMYVEMESADDTVFPLTSKPTNEWVAERAIKDVELSVGGQRIDKHYQTWWRLYSELYLDESKKANWGKMTTGVTGKTVYLPLIFFFNRNPGLALPLIALQYHEVRLDFDLTSDFYIHHPPALSRYTPITSTSTLRSVGVLPRRATSTSLSRFSTLALIPSPPVRTRRALLVQPPRQGARVVPLPRYQDLNNMWNFTKKSRRHRDRPPARLPTSTSISPGLTVAHDLGNCPRLSPPRPPPLGPRMLALT